MSQDVNISVQKSTQIKFIKADIGLCPQKAKKEWWWVVVTLPSHPQIANSGGGLSVLICH